jgi:hypothetical protein
MAGSSDGEDENYWPGYVDALTTMTMVLTFILMVLGIVVFSLSQSVSRAYLEAIAEAAQVEGGTKSKTVQDLQNAIIEKLLSKSKDPGEQAPEGQPFVVSGLETTAAKDPNDKTENTAVENREKKLTADTAEGGQARVKLAEPDPVAYARPTGGGVAEASNELSGVRQSVAVSESKRDENTTRRTGEGAGGASVSGAAPTGLAASNDTPAGIPGGDEKNVLPPSGRNVGDHPGSRPAIALVPDMNARVLVPETERDGTFHFALPLPVPGAASQPQSDTADPATLAQVPADQRQGLAGDKGGNALVARLDRKETPAATPKTTAAGSSGTLSSAPSGDPAMPEQTTAETPQETPAGDKGGNAQTARADPPATQPLPPQTTAKGSSGTVAPAAVGDPVMPVQTSAETPQDRPAGDKGGNAQIARADPPAAQPLPPQTTAKGSSGTVAPAAVGDPVMPVQTSAETPQDRPAGDKGGNAQIARAEPQAPQALPPQTTATGSSGTVAPAAEGDPAMSAQTSSEQSQDKPAGERGGNTVVARLDPPALPPAPPQTTATGTSGTLGPAPTGDPALSARTSFEAPQDAPAGDKGGIAQVARLEPHGALSAPGADTKSAESAEAPPQPSAGAMAPLPRPRPADLTAGNPVAAEGAAAVVASAAPSATGTGGPGRGTAAKAENETKGEPGPNAAATRSAINRASEPEVGPAYAALLPEEASTATPRSGGVTDDGTSSAGVPLSRKAPPQPTESELLQTTVPPQLRKPGVGAQVTTSGATLTIRFLPKAIALSEQDRGALKLAMLDDRVRYAREFRVNGVATVTDGFSDERRSAFFRMMVVRNELVNSGLSADKIKLQLVESADKSDANIVKILAVP